MTIAVDLGHKETKQTNKQKPTWVHKTDRSVHTLYAKGGGHATPSFKLKKFK